LRCLTASEAAIRQYGCSRDEFLAMTIEDIELAEDAFPSRNICALLRVPLRQYGKVNTGGMTES